MESGKQECQVLNNVGVTLFEQGRFGDARKVFVAALQIVKQQDSKKPAPRRREGIPVAIWSNVCVTAKSDADFVWSRALRVPPLGVLDTTTLIAIMTLNFALCLHMTSITNSKKGLIQWTMRIYKTVLRLLRRTSRKLADRIKVAVYNNMASLFHVDD